MKPASLSTRLADCEAALSDVEQAHASAVAALEAVRREGKVCAEYETCDHISCQSSYAAWAIADAYLTGGAL